MILERDEKKREKKIFYRRLDFRDYAVEITRYSRTCKTIVLTEQNESSD